MDMIKGNVIWDNKRIPGRTNTRVELTDLIRFKDHWYCAFCEGDIHCNHPSGRAWIIRSANGKNWEQSKIFDWDSADVRDPMLSVTPEGYLMNATSIAFVSKEPRTDYLDNASKAETYIPAEAAAERKAAAKYYQLDQPDTPESDHEMAVARQSLSWLSADGLHWSSAFCCPSGVNTWRWKTTWHNGMGYSVGYDGKDRKGTLYRTRDGKNWRVLREHFFPDGKGTEATLAFGHDDNLHCLLRYSAERTMAGIGQAPYYQEWEWRELDVDCGLEHGSRKPARDVFAAHFGGPKLICLQDGRFFAAARMRWPWRDDGKITVFHFDPQQALLTIKAEIDGTSYPGLIEHNGRLWISYGSAVATEIALASIPIP